MTTAVEEFWGETVLAGPFATLEESEASLAQRAEMFPGLYELMPVDLPRKDVLDFGCGPGHDTVLMLLNGAHVTYCDVSMRALKITEERLAMHGLRGLAMIVNDGPNLVLPIGYDHIHCAGVLHHTSHPDAILAAFRGALRDGGECRIMVYDGDRSDHTQSDVPVTHWWGAEDMVRMAANAGFSVAEYLGGYDCSAPWRPNCKAACWKLK